MGIIMDYQLTLEQINTYADKAGQLYQQLAKKIENNHETYLDPTLQDEKDTNQYAGQIATIFHDAQDYLNHQYGEKEREINARYHGDVTADQLAEINQLKTYNLSEDELKGYLNKYQDNLALLKAFESVVKGKGWKINGMTYDNEMDMLHYFNGQMQTIVDGIAHGSRQTAVPLESKIAGRLLDTRIKEWSTKVDAPYTIERAN